MADQDARRYWCHRCKRALVNDAALKFRDKRDTATYLEDIHQLRHDGCDGRDGIIAMSKREAHLA